MRWVGVINDNNIDSILWSRYTPNDIQTRTIVFLHNIEYTYYKVLCSEIWYKYLLTRDRQHVNLYIYVAKSPVSWRN